MQIKAEQKAMCEYLIVNQQSRYLIVTFMLEIGNNKKTVMHRFSYRVILVRTKLRIRIQK